MNRKTRYKLINEGLLITNTTISSIKKVPGRITPGARVTNFNSKNLIIIQIQIKKFDIIHLTVLVQTQRSNRQNVMVSI